MSLVNDQLTILADYIEFAREEILKCKIDSTDDEDSYSCDSLDILELKNYLEHAMEIVEELEAHEALDSFDED